MFVLVPGQVFLLVVDFSPVSYHSTFASQARSFLYHRRCTAWILTESLCLLQATQPPCHVSVPAARRVNVSEFTQMWCWIPCKLSGYPGSRPPSFRPAAVFVDRCNQTLSWRIISHGLWPQAVLFNNVTPARPVAGFICRLSLYMRPCKYVETTTDRFN